MNNLFIGSIAAGILILESANGMSNSAPQYTPSNNSARNISNHNTEGNEIFLPVMNRRSSVSALELTNSTPQYIPNNSDRNSATGSRRSSVSALELQQNNTNRQYANQFFSTQQNTMNGQYINQFCSMQQNTLNTSRTESSDWEQQQNRQFLPNNANGQYINQFYNVQQNAFEEINGNTQKNTNILPILRNINSVNQSVKQRTDANPTPEQYNQLGYFPTAENNISSNPDFSFFTLSEVLQLVELLTEIIRKEQLESSNLKWQLEFLNRENQRYENEQKYFLPYKITQLKNQNTNLEKYAKDQDLALQEAILKQKNQQNRINYLEQQYENNQTEIAKLKNQITELKNQITKEKTSHETEVNDLREQLKREKQLNAVLNLNTAPVLENK